MPQRPVALLSHSRSKGMGMRRSRMIWLAALAVAFLCPPRASATIVRPPPDPAALAKATELAQTLPLETELRPGLLLRGAFDRSVDGWLEAFVLRNDPGSSKGLVRIFRAKVRNRMEAAWPQICGVARESMARWYAYRLRKPEDIEAATAFFRTAAGQTYIRATLPGDDELVQALTDAVRITIGEPELLRLLDEARETERHMNAANGQRD